MPEQEPQSRAGRAFDVGGLFIADLVVHGWRHHGVHQVELDELVARLVLAGFHRAAGDEDDRDVEAQGGHQHARGDLVAVEMQTKASAQWALTMYSTESAMRSREGSE